MALTTQQKLDEARDAYHRLLIGEAAADVTHNDRRVRYTQANIDQLAAYIVALELELDPLSRSRREPIRVVF